MMPFLTEMEGWPRVSFRGPDRKKFLQGLLTNDILGLAPGNFLPSLILTPKGMLLGDFVLYDRGEDLLAAGRPAALANLQEALRLKLTLSETQMMQEPGGLLHLCGSRSLDALRILFGHFVQEGRCFSAVLDGRPIWLLPYEAFQAGGWLIHSPDLGSGESARRIRDKIGWLVPAGEGVLEILRVERGTPVYGVDMDSTTLPQEARLESAISFSKGCYMGQETMSRIKHMGHVNRLLAGLKLSEVPPPGAVVLSGEKETGKVTSAVASARLGAGLALALVRAEDAAPGRPLSVSWDGKTRAAEAVGLPL